MTLLQGKPGGIQVRLQNLYDRQIAGTMVADIPAGMDRAAADRVST